MLRQFGLTDFSCMHQFMQEHHTRLTHAQAPLIKTCQIAIEMKQHHRERKRFFETTCKIFALFAICYPTGEGTLNILCKLGIGWKIPPHSYYPFILATS